MIPAPPGLVALYKHDKPAHHTDAPVVAFDDDGHPLIIDMDGKRDKTRLIRADAYGNYDGMAEDPYPPLTVLLPAGGWRIEYVDSDGNWSEPLVGWALKGGSVVALATDRDGSVEDTDALGSGTYRIYHPDATPPQAATEDAP